MLFKRKKYFFRNEASIIILNNNIEIKSAEVYKELIIIGDQNACIYLIDWMNEVLLDKINMNPIRNETENEGNLQHIIQINLSFIEKGIAFVQLRDGSVYQIKIDLTEKKFESVNAFYFTNNYGFVRFAFKTNKNQSETGVSGYIIMPSDEVSEVLIGKFNESLQSMTVVNYKINKNKHKEIVSLFKSRVNFLKTISKQEKQERQVRNSNEKDDEISCFIDNTYNTYDNYIIVSFECGNIAVIDVSQNETSPYHHSQKSTFDSNSNLSIVESNGNDLNDSIDCITMKKKSNSLRFKQHKPSKFSLKIRNSTISNENSFMSSQLFNEDSLLLSLVSRINLYDIFNIEKDCQKQEEPPIVLDISYTINYNKNKLDHILFCVSLFNYDVCILKFDMNNSNDNENGFNKTNFRIIKQSNNSIRPGIPTVKLENIDDLSMIFTGGYDKRIKIYDISNEVKSFSGSSLFSSVVLKEWTSLLNYSIINLFTVFDNSDAYLIGVSESNVINIFKYK